MSDPAIQTTSAPQVLSVSQSTGEVASFAPVPAIHITPAQTTQTPIPPIIPPSSTAPSPTAIPPSTPPQLQELPTATPPVAPSAGTILSSDPNSLLNILVDQGSLTKLQAESLTFEEANTGKTLEELLSESEMVSEEDFTKAKAKLYNLPFVQLAEIGVSPEAISIVPESVARRYHLLPFSINKPDRILSIAMVNPTDLAAIDFVAKQTGFEIQPYFSPPSDIERTITERYSQNLSSEVTEALEESKFGNKQNRLQDLSALSKEVVREAPINKIVETILAYAIKSRASDVHIEPQEDRTRVRYRIDGILTEKLILPQSVHDAVLSRIKILSNLKIDEKRLPQDGRFTFTADGEEVDLRISTLPTIHGEKVVMRLLKKNASVPTMAELGLRAQALRELEDA